jgi:hypothetical protein
MSTEVRNGTMCGRAPFPTLHPIFADSVMDHGSLALDRPFVLGGFVVATDGRLFVRTPVTAPGLDLTTYWQVPGLKYPKGIEEGLAAQGPHDDDPTPIPGGIVSHVTCWECGGTGEVVDPEYGHGPWDCGDCDGEKLIESRERVPVGGFDFQAYYLAVLALHGVTGLRLSKNPPRRKGDKRGGVSGAWFTGDGFEGMLAPMFLED